MLMRVLHALIRGFKKGLPTPLPVLPHRQDKVASGLFVVEYDLHSCEVTSPAKQVASSTLLNSAAAEEAPTQPCNPA